jgi:hypothetical protein
MQRSTAVLDMLVLSALSEANDAACAAGLLDG